MAKPALEVTLPGWAAARLEEGRRLASGEDRVLFAIDIARENVLQGTGGPFGAAVFESESGVLVSIGMNLVASLQSSILHGEMVAILLAQSRIGSYTLRRPDLPAHELVTSCEPCAMCLGAAFWSGVTRLVCGATREDAVAIGFDEGPVFPESYDYLSSRGIEVVRGVARDAGRAVLELYKDRGGLIYNA